MQVTPSYGGSPHVEFGIYFKTGSDVSSAYGSNALIIEAREATRFSLTFNSDAANRDGAATVTVLRLNRGASV